MKRLLVLTAFAVPVFFASCGNDKSKTPETTTTEQTKEPATNDSGTPVSNTVELTAGDEMKFDKIEIRVKANEKVTLTLKNVGKMPIQSMGHNFVLLKDDVNLEEFAKKANQAPDHIPADMSSVIIAHTKLLGPGESDTIEFTVPAGSYTYICSFPGHYQSMMGILTAE